MRRESSLLFPLISILLLFSALSFGQAWSGILAPARAADWTNGGIPGGIPSGAWANCTTTACNTLFGGTVTASSIMSAISSAPNNTVVRVPAGNFTISSGITNSTNRSNVVLRGAGPQQTKLTMSSGNITLSTGGGGLGSWPDSFSSVNLTGTASVGGDCPACGSGLYPKGATHLTMTSTSGIGAVGSSGQVIVVDERNPAYVFVTGVYDSPYNGSATCVQSNSCGRNDSPLRFNGAQSRAQQQMVSVINVDSATQITIAAPGLSHNLDSSLAPQAFWWKYNNRGGPIGNAQYVGIENMTVDVNFQDAGISLPECDYCWVKNLAILHTARGGVFFYWGYRDEVRDSYLQGYNSASHPEDYGVDLISTTFSKVENNIFFGMTASMLSEDTYGAVWGYNFAEKTPTDNQYANYEPHLGHTNFDLFEGNVVLASITYDFIHGSGSHNTAFRSYIKGHGPNTTGYRYPVKVNAKNRYVNLVGNVLGDPTYHTQYVCDDTHSQANDVYIYDLGFWGGCGDGYTSFYDTVVQSSLVRWGNWDAVTWKANGNTNGVRWCTGSGAGNPACTASETASTDPTFPGLASPGTSLPASFYTGVTAAYPSCGTGLSFWKNPSTGTCPPYPPIGPDVSCTTNCSANTAGHAAMIPAQLCYANTAKDGNGFLTAFDANACYTDDPSSGDPGPDPPTGVAATAH
jgi:hypothetical protein